MSMSNLITPGEIIAKGDELIEMAVSGHIAPGALRRWYDQLRAEREEKASFITIKDGSKIKIGKRYDLTVEMSRPGKTQTLRGYVVDSRGATWSSSAINVHKPRPEPGLEWQGPRRVLMPYNILSAVEVSA